MPVVKLPSPTPCQKIIVTLSVMLPVETKEKLWFKHVSKIVVEEEGEGQV